MTNCTYCGIPVERCKCAWKFDHEKAKQLIAEANLLAGTLENRPKQVMQDLAKLLKETLGFDLERRTYYDNYKLVKDDWNILRAAMFAMTPSLKAFRESDHSYDRAPTQEGQAVLDAWDEVEKALAARDAKLRKVAFVDNRVSDSDKSGE